MNKTNILATADAIEHAADGMIDSKLGFNMLGYLITESPELDQTGHECGTVACIAGWAVAVEHGAVSDPQRLVVHGQRAGYIPDVAQEFLGLTDRQASYLFQPPLFIPWSNITPRQAVATLRHLAETGEVKWGE